MQDHKSPLLTTDVVLFSFIDYKLNLLLIQRKNPPFQGDWAFPGGFLDYGEPPEVGALRELQEETGLENVVIHQVGAFGDPSRDPRGHTVSVVYYGFAEAERAEVKGTDDAADARWFDVTQLPKLAFDHDKILSATIRRINQQLRGVASLLEILPGNLPASDLSKVAETISKMDETLSSAKE